MKLINQSFYFISQSGFGLLDIYRHIERCARVCYKSEDRITSNSCIRFVDSLISSGHSRPLEFGTVHLKFSRVSFASFRNKLLSLKEWNDQWIRYNSDEGHTYATTNYRYYLRMKSLLKNSFFLEGNLDPSDNDLYPKRYTVHFILSRGIMDEFRTHVGLSHLAESSRYCNYSKDKFNGEVTFIKPNWYIDKDYKTTLADSKEEMASARLQAALEDAESAYLFLLKNGCKPQQAREVLPLSVKSELISCGFKKDWDNFFYRRNSPSAHPMAQEIASSLQSHFSVKE